MRASESGYVSVGASWQGPTEGVSGSLRRSRAPLLRCCLTLLTSPTSGSWLNVVEVFLGIITRQAIRRRTFTSVKGLIAAIETYIDAWNERCQIRLDKTVDEILTKATGGQRSSFMPHQNVARPGEPIFTTPIARHRSGGSPP